MMMNYIIVVSVILSSMTSLDATVSFMAIGDWGGAALGGQDTKNVYAVANAMATKATQSKPSFILNTGDNFYWCGIQNTSDYQIKVDYETPYSASSLQLPWYSILGNHEYGYNVDAQIDYATKNKNWIMDDRYYTRRLEISSNVYITFVFLDTSPCISAYRSSNPSGWDPCGTSYPTCSLSSSDDDFEGSCEFHSNIMSQDCSTQFSWFKSTLNNVPSSDWLIVAGHHPIDEVDVEDFTSALEAHGFSIYFNGHTHTLCQYTIDNKGAYVTTGAGALVNTADQQHGVTGAKAGGKDLEVEQLKQGTVLSDEGLPVGATHSYQTVFNSKTAGFTYHTFSSDFSTLRTDFVSYTGAVLHSFTVNKAGTVS